MAEKTVNKITANGKELKNVNGLKVVQVRDEVKGNTYNLVTELETPNTYLNGSIVEWGEVQNATQYSIHITGAGTKQIAQASTSIDLRSYFSTPGTYTIKVRAEDNTGTYEGSEYASESITLTRLSAPSISLSNSTLSWSSISNARGYEIYINNSKYTSTTGTSYSLSSLKNSYGLGTYSIYVVAKANTTGIYLDSSSSNTISYEIKPGTITFSASGDEWPENVVVKYNGNSVYLRKFPGYNTEGNFNLVEGVNQGTIQLLTWNGDLWNGTMNISSNTSSFSPNNYSFNAFGDTLAFSISNLALDITVILSYNSN